jgi:hypothetical protein
VAISPRVTVADVAGNSTVGTAPTVKIDKLAPLFDTVRFGVPSPTELQALWSTSEATTGQVEYGTTSAYGTLSPLDGSLSSKHSAVLSGLQPDTTYHARLRAVDIASNLGTSDEVVFHTSGGSGSLQLDGSTGYAQAAAHPELNAVGDWTIETWFKDEDPNGFNHPYVTLLTKGDRTTNAESPYLITLGFKRLVVGQRTNWSDVTVNYDLWGAGVNPNRWHHVAATFERASRRLSVYLDGVVVVQAVLPAVSRGNTEPVQIGRNGPAALKNFRGKLDDVRIWSLVRSPAEISAAYKAQLSVLPSGLVANWRFDDGSGRTARDSTDAHHDAGLQGGSRFSTEVHQ